MDNQIVSNTKKCKIYPLDAFTGAADMSDNPSKQTAVQRLDRYLREMDAIECCVVRHVSFDPDMKRIPTAEEIAAEMLQWFAAIDAGLLPCSKHGVTND